MERPQVTDYFDNNEKGNIQSLDVDFPSYQSALNEYIDQLEAENKELREKINGFKINIIKDEVLCSCGGKTWYDFQNMYYVCHDCDKSV